LIFIEFVTLLIYTKNFRALRLCVIARFHLSDVYKVQRCVNVHVCKEFAKFYPKLFRFFCGKIACLIFLSNLFDFCVFFILAVIW